MQQFASQHLLRQWTPFEQPSVAARYRGNGFWGTRILNLVIIHRADLASPPADWNDLLNPAYRGAVAIPDPGFAGSAYGALAYFGMSTAYGIDFYRKLKANGAIQVPAIGDVITGVAEGRFKVGMSLDVTTRQEMVKGSPIKIAWPRSGAIAIYSPIAVISATRTGSPPRHSSTSFYPSLVKRRSRRPAGSRSEPGWSEFPLLEANRWNLTGRPLSGGRPSCFANIAPSSVPEEPVSRRLPRALITARAVAIALVVGLVGYPISVLVAAAGSAGRAGIEVALESGLVAAAINTLWTATAVTAISVAGGLAAAMVTERMAGRIRAPLRVAMLIPLAIPPFVAALGWTEAYGPNGIAARQIGLSLPGLYGPAGVVAVLAVEGVPLAYAVVAAGLATRSEPDLERAARASGANARTAFLTITLRLLRPALAAAGVLVFVTTANSFGVPQVLGVPSGFATLTTRIYQQLTFSADPSAFSAALVLALVLLAIPLAAVGLGDAFLGGRTAMRGAGGEGYDAGASLRLGPTLIVCAYLAATTAVPLLALVLTALTRAAGLAPTPGNWTLDNFRQSLGGVAGAGLGHSLTLAVLSASAVLLMGGLVAALGRNGLARPLATVVTATYALAGSGLALAILLAYGPLFRYSLALILIAYLAKFWALGHRPIAGSVDRLPRDLVRAARASGASAATSVRTIVIPLLRPALAASWLLVFLAALHELTISSLLYAPGSETLAVAVLNLQELGDVTVTAALAVLLTGLVLAAAGLLFLVRRLALNAGNWA